MITPQQIYSGGAGEGGGFLKCTATASISQVFECWAASSLATDPGENQSAVPCGNDVIMSYWVRSIELRHLEFHARTLYLWLYWQFSMILSALLLYWLSEHFSCTKIHKIITGIWSKNRYIMSLCCDFIATTLKNVTPVYIYIYIYIYITCLPRLWFHFKRIDLEMSVTLYFKVSLLQCSYTFKLILINYMNLQYG